MEIQEALAAGLSVQIQQPPLIEVQEPHNTRPADLPPEQVRAVEAVFAESEPESDQESRLVAGLLGMWTGTLVLHDVLKDSLTTTNEEELTAKKKKKEPPKAE